MRARRVSGGGLAVVLLALLIGIVAAPLAMNARAVATTALIAPPAGPSPLAPYTPPPPKTVLNIPPEEQPIRNPQFTQRPGADAFERSYPKQALAAGVGGRVVLDCVVDPVGRLNCAIVSEEPEGMGFGAAALDLAKSFRHAPLTDGAAAAGRHLTLPITFRFQ